MSNLVNGTITFFTLFTGVREVVVVGLGTGIISTVVVSTLVYIYKRYERNKRKARLPLRTFYLATYFKLTRKLRGSHITIDGFYYAVYDSSKSEKKDTQTDSSQPGNASQETVPATQNNQNDENERNKGTKVAECIYISTELFSSSMTGYVFRRAKRKNGIVEQNDYYSASTIISNLRIVGSFSYDLKIFFGYWLDPYKPHDVAGTVRLKLEDTDTSVQEHLRKVALVGHWDGFNKKMPLIVNENFQHFYGYAQAGGVWRFHRIGSGISEFNNWRDQLDKEGDNDENANKFLDWLPK